eukprot:CAMPEP_0114530228 /NCGR_PEP_ID=MMETSP0109-20121206/25307_1 /TAXON_ID=29199 /ORGANISM="Chlorarachnion reptans, Strain CCCM449" /LENGTH=210 /DNA_ID=CAMNT_0001712785 /DNA_START=181 /DNA_END=811 /DNA_ORIENTATION=+
MAETIFSQIALVVGNNRPYNEDGSLFETRCKVLANTPSIRCSKELFERVAEAGARGLPGFEVERQPLPILAVKRDKDKENVGEVVEVFKKHLQKPISYKQILATTTKMNAEYEKFLADDAKVDVTNNEAWKAAGYPHEMNAEGDDEPQRSEVSYHDPEFEYLAENASDRRVAGALCTCLACTPEEEETWEALDFGVDWFGNDDRHAYVHE